MSMAVCALVCQGESEIADDGVVAISYPDFFDALRRFDETPVPEIWAQCPGSEGLGLAVGNRLKKAAGFHIVEAEP